MVISAAVTTALPASAAAGSAPGWRAGERARERGGGGRCKLLALEPAGRWRWRLKTRYGLELRAATGADAPGVCELLSLAGREVSPSALAERLDAIRQEPGAALIAAEWGPPIGLVVLHWYRILEADQPVAQITTLLVAPPERRRGIGRLLVKTAAQAARVAGCGALELSTEAEDQALIDFCSASGFTAVGRRFIRPLRKKL
jgi:aminoglycoside 6'-N-acetyltransferase I